MNWKTFFQSYILFQKKKKHLSERKLSATFIILKSYSRFCTHLNRIKQETKGGKGIRGKKRKKRRRDGETSCAYLHRLQDESAIVVFFLA